MQQNNTDSKSLDALIAQLNLLTTDFIFNNHQCIHKASEIANQLCEICQHIELVFFPEQQTIYFKMLKVWQSIANQEKRSTTESKIAEPLH